MTDEKNLQSFLDGRAKTYGDATANMDSVAKMWTAYFEGLTQSMAEGEALVLRGHDVAMMMALYKTYRFAVQPRYSDNLKDIEGYTAIARKCIGSQLIEADSAETFAKLLHEQETVS